MTLSIAPLASHERAALHELVLDPSLRGEFDRLLHTGELADPLAHPRIGPGGALLARVDGTPAGFAILMRLEAPRGQWAVFRLGVAAPFRRRGVGGALLAHLERRLAALAPGERPSELVTSAWLPNEGAAGFLEPRGFARTRSFRVMERPRGRPAAPAWPAGVATRPFDGSERALADWTDCYNDAFAAHFASATATLEESRALTRQPGFRAAGLLLAYRGDRCVGFCRDTLFPDYGEVDVLGVRREAQGLGLGRALLRWGVAWLESEDVPAIRLTVDGDDPRALGLYRSEGFAVTHTRGVWTRRPAV